MIAGKNASTQFPISKVSFSQEKVTQNRKAAKPLLFWRLQKNDNLTYNLTLELPWSLVNMDEGPHKDGGIINVWRNISVALRHEHLNQYIHGFRRWRFVHVCHDNHGCILETFVAPSVLRLPNEELM